MSLAQALTVDERQSLDWQPSLPSAVSPTLVPPPLDHTGVHILCVHGIQLNLDTLASLHGQSASGWEGPFVPLWGVPHYSLKPLKPRSSWAGPCQWPSLLFSSMEAESAGLKPGHCSVAVLPRASY